MSDPYGSHLPVLAEVVKSVRPRQVLEYGGGHYSTPFFLAHVDELVTVECDERWAATLRADYGHEVVPGAQTTGFDLVFIDDGETASERLKTIRTVLSSPHPVVVIHDAEVPKYAKAIAALAASYSIFPTAPDTAVISATNQGARCAS